ncbi:MAG: 2-octaprenylphenol hydroxylase [Pseudohongiellaceae bacterium]|jgi:2-octaprenylphenol hydroxylase
MPELAQEFDVIVVGAGLAGCALVCALAQGDKTLRIALVEARPLIVDVPDFENKVDNFDPRVSALTLASQKLLQDMSVWSHIKRLAPYQKMHVWDADGTGAVDFDARDVNQPALGHIVENRLTQSALITQLQQQANVQCFNPAKVISMSGITINNNEEHRLLSLEDGRQLSAPLVVAADGAQSKLRELAGFDMREWDYHHHAIVATVQTEKSHQATAWQRFMPEGPLAFLPLQNVLNENSREEKFFCSIVWSALPGYADQLMALDNQAFCQQLTRAFEGKLGNILAVSKRFSFPLRQRHAINYVQPGLALIGDAAHTIHPLAGQGINLGFGDVAVLSEEILRARARSLNLSDFSILKRYQRRRKADNLSMMAAMDGFKRLFAEPNLMVRWARNCGMHGFNRSLAAKRLVMRSAMGLH